MWKHFPGGRTLESTRWISLASCIIWLAFFGFTPEVLRFYKSLFNPLSAILPSWMPKSKSGPTEIEFHRSDVEQSGLMETELTDIQSQQTG